MFIVIGALLTGVLLGRFVGQRVLKINDNAFMILSTVFVFLMGISLGLSRSIFNSVGDMFTNSILLVLIASLGSIVFTAIYAKLLTK